MLDFVNVFQENGSRKTYISASFTQNTRIKDLMTIGKEAGTFYAVWDFENECWTKSKDRLYELIDICINEYVENLKKTGGPNSLNGVKILLATNSESGISKNFAVYTKGRSQNFRPLDTKVVFKSDPPSRELYSSHRLPYDPIEMDTPCYDKLMSVLYKPEEQQKIEWLIGAGLCRDNDKIQKFGVLYGEPGTGKGTVLDIIKMLFDGYTASFEADALASKNDQFALEPFKNHPVVAIQTDGNLSRIEDNARLNTLIAHETLTVNEKFKGKYDTHFDSILFIGTNEPVKITNAKSGLLRRLIDIEPTGNIIPKDEYDDIKSKLPFELPGIAFRCMELYRNNKKLYNAYRPMLMMARTNEFYDFILEYYDRFNSEDYILLSVAWEWYKKYIEDAHGYSKMSRRAFASELSTYFEYGPQDEWGVDENGNRKHMSSVYRNFKKDKFKNVRNSEVKVVNIKKTREKKDEPDKSLDFLPEWLRLFDITKRSTGEIENDPLNVYLRDGFAQYAETTESGTSKPKKAWDFIKSKLSAIDTTREHYILTQSVDPKLIVIDFDLKDPTTGKKSLERNLMAAKMFPVTYAETSKSGNGLHLHYIYDGDPEELSMVFDKEIEIKVFKGKSALRRKLYLCNNEAIAHISSGLPLKEVNKKMIDWEGVQNEKHLRALIEKGLQRKVFANTKPSIDYIAHVMEEAYDSGISYNVSDLQPRVLNMAYASTNNSDYCVEKVLSCEFMSEDNKDVGKQEAKLNETEYRSDDGEKPIIFIDSEIFPNLFVVCYKFHNGGGKENCVKLINPSSNEISNIVNSYRMIGFNIRGYDAHLFYARILGYSNEQLYELSKKIIGKKTTGFKEALRMAYADIYDYTSLKQSLKLYEIDLGIHHQECPYKWDEPVPEDAWDEISDYCCNDVVSTEAVFDDPDRQADFMAREMLSELSGLPIIDTTRQHCTKIIFGNERHPQLVYTDLSTLFPGYEFNEFGIDKDRYIKDEKGKPICTSGKSIYMGEDPSEGGFVFTRPGYYVNVKCYDVSGMHPSSLIALNKFGDKTKIYADIVAVKTHLKHKEFDKIEPLFNGKFKKYLVDEAQAAKLKKGTKLIGNSVYGYCSATFDNPFKDPRDKDNIVAKRGALFMITLKNEVIKRGYTVIHCKTDSIKVVDPDEEIEQFIFDFGKKYGYTFEIEEDFEKICLFNKAVFIGKDKNVGWMAVGAEFQHPYIFKTLFSHEPIAFNDMCESKTVTNDAAIYLDMNEDLIEPYLREIENAENELACETISSRKMEIKKRIKELKEEVENTHELKFIGKFGNFCPVKPGFGGGIMLRMKDDKLGSVNGTKGYRWMESEYILRNHLEDIVDLSYFRRLVDEAVKHIEEYVPFDEFVND